MHLLKLQNTAIALLAVVMLITGSCKKDKDPDPKGLGGKYPNIIVLTVDTLRADHLTSYRYRRNTMPTIEQFAETAAVFDNAIVSRGITRTSYASILTGLYPFRHGVYNSSIVMHDKFLTLPEILNSKGYHTAAFMSNFVLVGELSGFDQGFDIYDDFVEDREAKRENYERIAEKTAQAILDWLGTDPPEPFFLFTNFIDPHGPYSPPKRFGDLYQSEKSYTLKSNTKMPGYQRVTNTMNFYDYLDAYDEEIRYVDEAMALVIEKLKLKGLWDDAIVIFTADHGESFGEHGVFFDHREGLWEATTRVPLMIRIGRDDDQNPFVPKRISSISSPMDLMPTILDYLDISFDGSMDGESLLEALKGREKTERMFFLELPKRSTLYGPDPWPNTYSVRTPTHKLIRTFGSDMGQFNKQAVFDIKKDPMEQKPLGYDKNLQIHREMAQYLDDMLAKVHDYKIPFSLTTYQIPLSKRKHFIEERSGQREMIYKQFSPEQAEKLRSLGYVD